MLIDVDLLFCIPVQAIKDWHLMMIVLALCSVVVIFFTAVAIFGNYRAKEVQDNERADSRNVSESP